MALTEQMGLVNFSLRDILKTDRYRLKVLKNLEKLVEEEYVLQNYELSNKYALQYLKMYKRLAKEFVGSTYLDTRVNDDKQAHGMSETKYLSPKYLDRVVSTYMECRKFLVGPLAHKLITDINTVLPGHEQWKTFTDYIQMVEYDGKYADSTQKQKLVHRLAKYTDKLLEQYEYLRQYKKVRVYHKILQ
jgi:hypothetical protein